MRIRILLVALMLIGCVSVSAQTEPPGGASPPVVVTQEDYNAVPVGGQYYFHGRLLRKRSWSTTPAPSAAPLVATPTFTSPPVVVTQEDYDAVPLGELYYYKGQLLRKRSWSTTPAPSAPPLVATPTPTSPPVVVTKEDYDAVPLGNPYWWKGQLYTKGTSPWQAPVSPQAPESAPTQKDDAKDGAAMLALLAIFAATIGFAIYRRKPRPKSQSADPGATEKRTGRVYDDYDQFKLAMQLWDRDRQLFEQNETARLTQLNEQVKKGGPVSSVGCLGFIIAALVVGGVHGAGAGWGTIILGLFVVGAVASAEEQLRRWRYKALFVRRAFDEPEPVYEPPPYQQTWSGATASEQEYWRSRGSPPPQEQPPPRQESPPRTEERQEPPPPKAYAGQVTSMRQAYEILGLPPGRITLDAARRAYRALINQYHPDKVAHLGPELREVAKNKTLEINLAMQFIEANCK